MLNSVKYLKNKGLASLGFLVLLTNPAFSQESVPENADPVEALQVLQNRPRLSSPLDSQKTTDQNFNFSSVREMEQVTNVSELRDVKPTAWAYESLKSLVERYGCIVGYPDRTFRGDRALSRWEFAAGLNACLNTMERLLQENVAVLKEDIDKLKRLSEEFAQELAALGARVDNLESRTAYLEDHQFSTTTKLSGLAWINLSGAYPETPFKREVGRRDPVTNAPIVETVDNGPAETLGYLTWLELNTSFTGSDSLFLQLAAGNGFSPANLVTSAGFFNTTGVQYFDQGTNNDLWVRILQYSFPLFDKATLTVGPRINQYFFFDENNYTSIFTGASSFNHSGSTLLGVLSRGAGAVAVVPFNDTFTFKLGYLAESDEFNTADNTSAANPTEGLFGGTYELASQLNVSPADNLNLRFIYAHSLRQARNGLVDEKPTKGLLDDGQGGDLSNALSNTFIFNFDWRVANWLGLFGRYGIAGTTVHPVDGANQKITTQAFQAGFALLDLFKEGAKGTVSFLMPYNYTEGRNLLVSGGGNGAVQYELEVDYFYPINNNLAIIPNVTYVWNLNNFSDQNMFSFNVRTQFSF